VRLALVRVSNQTKNVQPLTSELFRWRAQTDQMDHVLPDAGKFISRNFLDIKLLSVYDFNRFLKKCVHCHIQLLSHSFSLFV